MSHVDEMPTVCIVRHMRFDDDTVFKAILDAGGVSQGAENLGVTRWALHKTYRNAVLRATAELARRRAEAPVLVPFSLKLPAEITAELDAAAREAGTNRSAVAAELLASLPATLPAPLVAGGPMRPIKAPAAVLAELRRRCDRDTNGVIRALLVAGLAKRKPR